MFLIWIRHWRERTYLNLFLYYTCISWILARCGRCNKLYTQQWHIITSRAFNQYSTLNDITVNKWTGQFPNVFFNFVGIQRVPFFSECPTVRQISATKSNGMKMWRKTKCHVNRFELHLLLLTFTAADQLREKALVIFEALTPEFHNLQPST